jgi:glycosyltransferase involved in cell wall biosynthesis
MRLLYLTYGTHSGIVDSHNAAFKAQGVTVSSFDASTGFDYRMKNVKLPSLHPINLLNTLIALKRYGKDWQWFYRRTDLAFRRMSSNARRYWKAQSENFDVVLQSGVLFHGAPDRAKRKQPFLLHLDHTYALSKHAPSVPSLRSACPASAEWEEMERRTYHDADWIFTMSECVRDSLIQSYAVPAERITVVGGGPNFPELPLECPVPPIAPTVLFVGKDFSRKGGPVLLEAFRRVRAELPQAQLLVVGPRTLGAEPGIVHYGTLSHAEMADVYRQAQVFVLPSWREPFGIAFIEAMAFGLPCVGTRIEAIPEIIDEGRTGFLIPPGDANELAVALLNLLQNPKRSAEMGAAGFAKVKAKLNWENTTKIMHAKMVGLTQQS